jgi:hypothetical protein
MKIDANLNNVKELDSLPTSAYSATVLKEPKAVVSSQKKTPGIEFEFTLTDVGTELAPGVPRTITHTVYRSEKSGWEHFKMKELCEACGVPLENPDTADFVNTTLKLAISQEPYKDRHGLDKTRNVIDYFLKA